MSFSKRLLLSALLAIATAVCVGTILAGAAHRWLPLGYPMGESAIVLTGGLAGASVGALDGRPVLGLFAGAASAIVTILLLALMAFVRYGIFACESLNLTSLA